MNIEPVVLQSQDEHADVRHGAHVDKLLDPILDVSLVNGGHENPLENNTTLFERQTVHLRNY